VLHDLRIGRLLTLHVFLGMLLLGPVTLRPYQSSTVRPLLHRQRTLPAQGAARAAAAGHRAGHRAAHRVRLRLRRHARGHRPRLRLSGWLTVHRISFIAWAFFIVIHVLTYAPRLPRLLAAEARGASLPEGETSAHARASRPACRVAEIVGGRGTRLALLTASLLGGLVIALLTVHLAGKWETFGCPRSAGLR